MYIPHADINITFSPSFYRETFTLTHTNSFIQTLTSTIYTVRLCDALATAPLSMTVVAPKASQHMQTASYQTKLCYLKWIFI